MIFKTFALFLFLLPITCLAQFTISGRVVNLVDNKPVPNASVFLSNATIGSTSADNGTFSLAGVKSGKYTLVVSIVGYETFTEPVLVNRGDIKLDDIGLMVKTKQLKEVVIKPDNNRERYLTMFKEQFLGKSELAQQCKILNPEVLDFDFDEKTNTLTASAISPLEITNPGLGYTIKYLLNDFMWVNDPLSPVIRYRGNFLFRQMSGTLTEQRRWLKTRQEVYKNSPVHFYRSVIADRITEEGFKVQQYASYANPNRPSDSLIEAKIAFYKKTSADYKSNGILKNWLMIQRSSKTLVELRPFPLGQQDILKVTNQPSLFALGCDFDKLFVTYNEKGRFGNLKVTHIYNPNNTEATLISFDNPFAFIDRNGIIVTPYDVNYTGVWASERIADLLPIDYDPPQADDIQIQVDSTVSNKVIAGLTNYVLNHITEKAYLHFDKPYYAAGDTMYFKAYLTSGEQHQLTLLSGVLHVDLINSENKIDKSISLDVNDGVAWGDFALPDSLPKGNYRVRAYTQWMRNSDDPGFFYKSVPVAAVLPAKANPGVTAKSSAAKKPDIQFFPEGGSLITGVRSKVAFKAIGVNGLGINVKGVVLDNDNKQVGAFTATHLGMGYFYLTPEDSKIYKAKVTYPNGTQDVIELPHADEKGVALAITSDSTKIAVNILAGKTYFKANQNKDHTLIIYSGGVVTSIICKLDSVVVPVDVFRQALHTGIARFTLFSPSGEPLSERLVFVQNYDQLKFSLKTDRPVYAPRAKVSIDMDVANNEGEGVAGHFSVAVTDESRLPVDQSNENTIVNNLLLTSDLKGYVEQPNYYFTADATEALGNLDLLMLTQGYRGFEWKQVFDTKKTSIAYQPENGLSINGTVKSLDGKPIPNGEVMLASIKRKMVRDTTADANGKFVFNEMYITDTSKLLIRPGKNNRTRKVEIDQPDYPAVIQASLSDTAINMIKPEIAAEMKKRYEQSGGNMKNGIVLKEVKVNSTSNPSGHVILTHSANLNGPGRADQVIMGDKLKACANLADCLISLIHGARIVYGSSGPVFYSIQTSIALSGPTKPMVVILDGTIRDQSALSEIAYTDVYSIEILESPAYFSIYGSSATGGAIVITTKRGDEGGSVNIQPGLTTYVFNGFYKARQFYSPKYDTQGAANSKPDQRTTIYWNPELTTGKDGNASFEFYNADKPGTYRIVVEGIDENGNIGRHVYYYKVN